MSARPLSTSLPGILVALCMSMVGQGSAQPASGPVAVTDTEERWTLELSNRTLHARPVAGDASADARVRTTRATLAALVGGQTDLAAALAAGDLEADGDRDALALVFDHLDPLPGGFTVVEP